jgi:hypothetical protein
MAGSTTARHIKVFKAVSAAGALFRGITPLASDVA